LAGKRGDKWQQKKDWQGSGAKNKAMFEHYHRIVAQIRANSRVTENRNLYHSGAKLDSTWRLVINRLYFTKKIKFSQHRIEEEALLLLPSARGSFIQQRGSLRHEHYRFRLLMKIVCE